ncbi:hypothetical protein L0222_16380, partial [bacterium]|nr:hypothetical protein [bacterium]
MPIPLNNYWDITDDLRLDTQGVSDHSIEICVSLNCGANPNPMLPMVIGTRISDHSRFVAKANIQRRSFYRGNRPKVGHCESEPKGLAEVSRAGLEPA